MFYIAQDAPRWGRKSTPCAKWGVMTITAAQCRAARALIEMDQATLAVAANVSRNTVVGLEKGQRTPNPNNLAAIQRALEAAGVEFLEGGVKLKGG